MEEVTPRGLSRQDLEAYSTDDLQRMKMLIGNILDHRHIDQGQNYIQFPPIKGDLKIQIIKAIRAASGIGLREAADLANAGGSVVDTRSPSCSYLRDLLKDYGNS